MRSFAPYAALLAFAVAVPSPARSAAPDNNVEWNGISHISWQDRRPVCPRNNETFQVRFQAYRNDLTAARVRVDDGGAVTWAAAAATDTRGVYDIWTAQVPATTNNTPNYYIEVTDGTDTDFYSVNGMSDLSPTDGGFVLNFTTLEHAPVGTTPVSGGTVFRVWAPTRTTVNVPGQFNGWSTSGGPLAKVGEHFIGYVPGANARQQYKFLFNGSHWNSDARSRAVDPSNNYNSILEDPFSYQWVNNDFLTPPLESMVIYQLHTGTFSGRNDPAGSPPFPGGFSDVAARVGHLAELGVNAVMLNPIFEFPGDESAGYNPVSAWAPEWIYGTPNEFKNLVDVCHQNGIAVLLDIVWNHFSSTDNFLWNYDGTQIYFDTPAVGTPWGDQADFDEPEVADYYAHSSLYLMEEFRIDGFRMDATDFMNMGSHGASGWALMQRFNDEMDNRFADKVAIAEQLPDDSWVTRPTSLGGAGFDSQYWDAFTDQLRQEIFDAASGSPEMWRFVNMVNGGGVDLSNAKTTNYLELHDEAWPTSGGQRIVKTIDPTAPHDDQYAKGRSKLGQGFVMLAPGVPAILQGTEWLEDTDFGTSLSERIDWSKKTTYAGIFEFYKDLIALRTGKPAFWANSAHQVTHSNEAGDVMAFTRSGGGETYLVVVNAGNTDYDSYRVGVPTAGAWAELINSQSAVYEGNGQDNAAPVNTEAIGQDGFGQSVQLNLAPMTIAVFQDAGAVVSAPEIAETDGADIRLRFANPASAGTSISFSLPQAGRVLLDLVDARGRRLATLQDGSYGAGEHRVNWDGRINGTRPAAGVYFLRLSTDTETVTRKITLIR